jgi:ABC-type branched-subunit amino acid transport system substrate-binding protein
MLSQSNYGRRGESVDVGFTDVNLLGTSSMANVGSDVRGDSGRRLEGAESFSEGGRSRVTRTLKKRRVSRRAKTVFGAIATAVLALSAVWIISGISEPVVTIVAILPLSGASSYLVEIEDAMTLTVEKLNRWGGINGMHIRLVVLDCQSSPEVAVEVLHEAEDKYHPLAVVTATRGAAVSMSEFAEENGIVLISVGATAETLTEGKDWVFRYYVTPSGEAENALGALEGLNASSLGILHLDDAYGTPVMRQLTDGFEALGGTVESYGFPSNNTEFSDAVASVIDNDAVFAVALRHQFPFIFDELNSSGYSGHVLGAVESSIPEMWGLPDAQGTLVSAPMMYRPGAAVDTEFMVEYEERFDLPLTHQGAIGSDVLMLIWGLLSDSEVSRERLRNLLDSGFVFSGILGVTILEQGTHNFDVAVYPALIEGGGLRYL